MNFLLRIFFILMKFVIDVTGEIYYKLTGSHLINISLTSILNDFDQDDLKILNDDQFLMKNLSLAIKSYRNAKVSLFGRFSAKNFLLMSLKNRVEFEKYYNENKERIDNVQLKKPVCFITHPRTGSTFLHCLLLKDKSWFSQRLWMQMKFTCSPSNPHSEEDKKLIKKYRMEYDSFRSMISWKDVKAIHDVDVTDPEDIIYEYGSYGMFFMLAGLDGMQEYNDYLNSIGYDEWFEVYKKLKRNFQCYKLNYPDTRLLLMTHSMMGNFKAFYRTFPDCQIITIHRDPVDAINSVISLGSVFVRVHLPYWNLQIDTIKESMRLSCIRSFGNYMNFREEIEKEDNKSNSRFIDLDFLDVVKKPLAVLKKLYKDLDMEWSDEVEKNFSEYINNQGKHGKVKHKYKTKSIDRDYHYNILKGYINKYNVQLSKP